MKNFIVDILQSKYDSIILDWTERILSNLKNKLTESQVRTFADSSINTFIEIIDKSEYKFADQYLIDIYNLFSKVQLSILDISHIFSCGRYTILAAIEGDKSKEYDPILLLSFLDELFEQIFARYSMIHQETKMEEVESDRDRLANKLDMNQQYLKNILHASDSAIMVVDDQERFVAWSKGAEEIFGYTEDEVLYKPSTLLLPNEHKYFNELKQIQTEAKRSGFYKILETERKTKKGNIISVRLNVTKLPSPQGEYIGRTIIINDYSEVKKLQEQVDQSEKLAVIGQLAAGIAHEIGNPLASISSIVQILQRKNKDKFTNEQLATIKENIDRISKIVRELVDFSRPPSDQKSVIQITDVIKTALGIVKYDKRVKKVNFTTNLSPDLPKVDIIPDQLLQVFVNILINALDAIEGNGTISVKSSNDDEHVYIKITDDGNGISENNIKKIFNPFFTTKEVGKGTGLGLSVSYGIIKKFRGTILVESQVDIGSSFIIKLPFDRNKN
ncbi:nitrogen regulation protein NR(II) [Bacteroidota bacterium]